MTIWRTLTPSDPRDVPRVKASVSVLKNGIKVTLSFSDTFIRSCGAPKAAHIQTSEDGRQLRVAFGEDGDFPLNFFAKGGARIILAAWPEIPQGDREGTRCDSAKESDAIHIVTLPPQWFVKPTPMRVPTVPAESNGAAQPKTTNDDAGRVVAQGGLLNVEKYLAIHGHRRVKRLSKGLWQVDDKEYAQDAILALINGIRDKGNMPRINANQLV